MAKKSPVTDSRESPRLIDFAAIWMARWGWIGAGLAILLVPLLIVAAGLDPSALVRRQERERALLAGKAREEAILDALPQPEIGTGVVDLTFKSLEFVPLTATHAASRTPASFGPQVPPRIRRFDHREVRITGYALPTRYERGRVQDFLILANQTACCYGLPPRFCDFILVHGDQPVDTLRMDIPTSFEGTLHVGDAYANDTWVALYTMDCKRITPSLHF